MISEHQVSEAIASTKLHETHRPERKREVGPKDLGVELYDREITQKLAVGQEEPVEKSVFLTEDLTVDSAPDSGLAAAGGRDGHDSGRVVATEKQSSAGLRTQTVR
jgi:hypothetical protein